MNIPLLPGSNLENQVVDVRLQQLTDAGDALTATLEQETRF